MTRDVFAARVREMLRRYPGVEAMSADGEHVLVSMFPNPDYVLRLRNGERYAEVRVGMDELRAERDLQAVMLRLLEQAEEKAKELTS